METHTGSRTDLQKNTLAIVLAGGRGTRLGPLTNKRVKPAVHFGAARVVLLPGRLRRDGAGESCERYQGGREGEGIPC